MKFFRNRISSRFLKHLLFALIVFLPGFIFGQTIDSKEIALEKTSKFVAEIAKNSYPKIKREKLRYKTFKSESNFFKARFSFGRFLTFRRMRHLIYVNPKVFSNGAPETGVKAILAHELAHVLYYTEKNRFQLLGLASLASKSFTRKFERKADLEAIARGYGRGLIEYREWLYKNIPSDRLAAKKRNYFSPEEIRLMLEILKAKPKKIEYWRRNVPISIDEIEESR